VNLDIELNSLSGVELPMQNPMCNARTLKINWMAWVVAPSLIFAATLLVFWWLDIDKRLAYYLSHLSGGFPCAFSPTYEFIFHRIPKIISGTVFIAMLTIAVLLIPWLAGLVRVVPVLARYRISWPWVTQSRQWLKALPSGTAPNLWITVLAMVFASEMIGHLKRASNVVCPIHVQALGGDQIIPLADITEPFPGFGPGGQCWPGGHSITGFIFLACFFGFMRMGMRKTAVISLVVAFVYGNFLGLAQVYRGQHYLSHHLWSAYLIWMFTLGWFVLCDWLGKVRHFAIRYFKKSPTVSAELSQVD